MNTRSIPNELLLTETAQLIAQGHTVTHMVRGNSMNPFMVDRRDKVIIGPFTDADLKKGAVVLARHGGGSFVLHRIIRRRGNNIVLMGDGNVRGTEDTNPAHVAGVVRAIIRKNKTYSCQGRVWQTYSAIWQGLKPLRRIILGVWRRI